MSEMTPWLALWPMMMFIGGVVWYFGKSANHSSRIARLEGRVEEHSIRLATGEATMTQQSKTLDRIEGKLDRILEAKHIERI